MGDMLAEYVSQHQGKMEVHQFTNGQSLIDDIQINGFYDIYLLDIIMAGMNGLELASTLRLIGDKGKIIFVTATVEYALASYDVNAFYYMVKPVDMRKLFAVLDRAMADIVTEHNESILIQSKNGDARIEINDISYIEVIDRVPRYHLKDGRFIDGKIIRSSFSEIVKNIVSNDSFALCGVSTVVNLDYIDVMDSEQIMLKDGTILYPSKSACSALRKLYKERIGKKV